MAQITSKTALVTGGSSGIGKSTVESLLAAGAKVYAAARRVEKMNDLESKGAVIVRLDVADEESMVSVVNSILEKEGSIDILVNNAGVISLFALKEITEKALEQLAE